MRAVLVVAVLVTGASCNDTAAPANPGNPDQGPSLENRTAEDSALLQVQFTSDQETNEAKWIKGAKDQSCDDVCQGKGGTCDKDGMSKVSRWRPQQAQQAFKKASVTCGYPQYSWQKAGPFVQPPMQGFGRSVPAMCFYGGAASCSAKPPPGQMGAKNARLCSCLLPSKSTPSPGSCPNPGDIYVRSEDGVFLGTAFGPWEASKAKDSWTGHPPFLKFHPCWTKADGQLKPSPERWGYDGPYKTEVTDAGNGFVFLKNLNKYLTPATGPRGGITKGDTATKWCLTESGELTCGKQA